MLTVPKPRRSNWLHRLWLCPTNLLGRLAARSVAARGPFPVGGERAPAVYFVLPEGDFWWFGAVTLGHVILIQAATLRGPTAKWVMAHELAHTRQHDVLGPLYLPTHALCQLISLLISLVRPVPRYTKFHAYNPLERAFLCVPFGFLVGLRNDETSDDPYALRVLEALSLTHFEHREH